MVNLDKRPIGDLTIVKPPKDYLSIDFKNYLLKEIEDNEKFILFNFSDLKKMDSESLSILISIYKALRSQHVLAVFGLKEEVEVIFRLTGMTKILPLFKSEEEGIKQIKSIGDKK